MRLFVSCFNYLKKKVINQILVVLRISSWKYCWQPRSNINANM